ncbi:MAG: DUF499 domain-containing protein [Opitutaceae bacterium]|jgi:hypothetical protein|nr:DUF499 domain-containing protein [Opitutaceae bacterium]
MSLQALCSPRPSVYETNRRATVLSLDAFLRHEIQGGDFFEENYFTHGMKALIERAFRHLAGGQAGSSVFLLSQAMGGGKTHSMIALGLLARDAALRQSVLGGSNPVPGLLTCQVIGFNGRNTDAPAGIWGSLAAQLGRSDQFARYVHPLCAAPGPEAWKQLLGREPVIIFLDELPPYLEHALAVPVGNSDLASVTTTALANLFVAVTEMNNVCLVLSDLAGTNYSTGQERLQASFDRAVQNITGEAKRIATPITPVNPNGDELYHILRKRLFATVAPDAEVNRVATAYRDALREAARMNLTTTSPESLHARVIDSYPFHPDLRELVGKFKENDGFQQTRGVIRLMQMVVADLWQSRRAESIELIHPYDFDLNKDEVASEIRSINPSLSEAIAHDIAHGGESEVEQIDEVNHTTDASDAARLILIASLSTTPGAIHGLREYQLVDCLQRPGRDLSTFKVNVLDKLATRAWYLHGSADGRLYFKNQQNLAAKLRATAQALHPETVDRMLREHLEECFAPSLKDCYQVVFVLPPPDQVQLDVDRTALVIVRPGGLSSGLPVSADWQAWWAQQPFKNRVLFLTGSRDTFQKVIDAARQTKALESIETDLRSENTPADDPQWRALDMLRDRIGLQFSAALKEAFDVLVYPSINNALRASGVDLAFAGNQNGEATLRKTLEAAQKFTTKIDDEAFRSKAEARLFGGSDAKVVLWSDFKRNAAVLTTWPLHKPSALDDLKSECVRRGLWREEGNHLRRGPFPPPTPEVSIRVLSTDDDPTGDGRSYLKVEPLHAPFIVFETGDATPTPASTPVPTPTRFEATGLRYQFLALDPAKPALISAVKEWTAPLRLKHKLTNRGDHWELVIVALPKAAGVAIRYTTDGSSPQNTGASTYAGPIRVPAGTRVVLAVALAPAQNLASAPVSIPIPQKGDDARSVDPIKPVVWRGIARFDDSAGVWDFIRRLEATSPPGAIRAHDVRIVAESTDGAQHVDYQGSVEEGYTAATIKTVAETLQTLIPSGGLRLTVGSLHFATGQGLLDWLRATGQPVDMDKVSPA